MTFTRPESKGGGNRVAMVVSVIFLTVLASFFRFYRLHTLPLGLYHDEGMNGNDALTALRTGVWKVFYPDNNGREGLFINLQAISIAWFGESPWALRAVSALMGVLAVLGLFMLVRDLYDVRAASEPGRSPVFSKWPVYGLVAGVIHATLIWPVVTSRLGLRAQMSSAAIVWLLWATLRLYNGNWVHTRTSRLRWSALAGVFLGIGLNSYIAFRVAPVLVGSIMVLALRNKREYVWSSAAILISFAAALTAPLAGYFIHHPSFFASHSDQVSVFAQHHWLLGIGYNIWMELQMCFWQGDLNWRHNFGGAPMLPWILQPFFATGILMMLWRIVRKWREGLRSHWRETIVFLWLVIGSLPNVFAESHTQPHGLRLLLIAPALSLIAAVGLVRVLDRIQKRFAMSRTQLVALAAIVLVALTGYEYDLLFNQFPARHEMHSAYSYPQWALARSLEANRSLKRRYVISPRGDTTAYGIPILAQSIAYLTHTLSPAAQDAKNIHYAIAGSLPDSDSVELIPIPW